MIEPVKIVEENASGLTISWSNDTESSYDAAGLRRSCPCASCRDEWTGKKLLKDDSVPDDLSFSHISIVGRYALNFHFSDGHDTGIYSFEYLKGLADTGET